MGFVMLDRLPWKATRRTLVLGLMIGSVMRGLRWGRDHLEEEARTRRVGLGTDDREEES